MSKEWKGTWGHLWTIHMDMGNNRNLPIFSNVKKMLSVHFPKAKIADKHSP
jgi:hypothetical protein